MFCFELDWMKSLGIRPRDPGLIRDIQSRDLIDFLQSVSEKRAIITIERKKKKVEFKARLASPPCGDEPKYTYANMKNHFVTFIKGLHWFGCKEEEKWSKDVAGGGGLRKTCMYFQNLSLFWPDSST